MSELSFMQSMVLGGEYADPQAPPTLRQVNPPDHQPPPDPRRDSPPEPERIEVEAYTISTYRFLDPARAWVDCPHGPDCPNRACVTRLYATELDARRAVPYYMLEQLHAAFSGFDSPLHAAWHLIEKAEFPKYQISRLTGAFDGRDYRESGCRIDRAFEQLTWGSADNRAWRVVRRHLERHGIYGAMLPAGSPMIGDDTIPHGSEGSLFVFQSGFKDLELTPITTMRGRLPHGNEV